MSKPNGPRATSRTLQRSTVQLEKHPQPYIKKGLENKICEEFQTEKQGHHGNRLAPSWERG
jgi:hypothetical protein